MELPTAKPAELKYSRDVSLDKGNGMKNHLLSLWQFAWDRAKSADTHKKKGWVFVCSISCAAIHKPVSNSRLCCNYLHDFALVFCRIGKGIAAELPKVVFVEILCKESEKQLLSCCHAVAMQKVKVNVRKWKWESAVAMQLPCWEAVSNLLPCKKWKWTWESESEKQLPSCWHVVAMQKVKVNVRKWKW